MAMQRNPLASQLQALKQEEPTTPEEPVSHQNSEQQDFLKSEAESMHKLIKELNEQAMDILYS